MKIMTAIDFSTATEAVLKAAKTYAKKLRAEVLLIHVEPTPVLLPDMGISGTGIEVLYEIPVDHKTEHVRLNKDAKALEACGVKVTPLLRTGSPAKTIIKEAEKQSVDLIIVGSHGHGALQKILIGSTSESILKKSKIPVLLIPVAH